MCGGVRFVKAKVGVVKEVFRINRYCFGFIKVNFRFKN